MPETVACALCQSPGVPDVPKTRLLNLHAPYEICRCPRCGLLFLNPRPTVDEMEVMYTTDPYYAADNATRGATRSRFYHDRMDRLERHRPERGRMLGVGCLEGGYALDVARARGWEVLGVEFSPILADHARSALGIDVRVARAWDLSGLRGERFDAIASQSLEHVPDAGLTLDQCAELLTPEGLLLLEVPNQFRALVDVLKMAVIRAGGAYEWFHRSLTFEFHTLYFTPRTIRRLLEQHGLEVLALRTYLPAHPLYVGRGPKQWIQRPAHAIGGLVGRGPCIEVIAGRAGARSGLRATAARG